MVLRERHGERETNITVSCKRKELAEDLSHILVGIHPWQDE